MEMKKKRRIYDIMDKADKGDIASKLFDISLTLMITLSISMLIMNSYEEFYAKNLNIFKILDTVCVVVFTIEYLVRLYVCEHKYIYDSRPKALLKQVFSFSGIVDLLAILPFYCPFFGINLRFLRILRVFKFIRIFELSKYGRSIEMIVNVLKREKEVLVSSLIMSFMTIFVSSVLMYGAENGTQPEAFPNIPSALWWAVATLTTVGYGDIYPVTPTGKIIASVIALVGIGLVAIPSGVISAGFVRELEEARYAKTVLENI